MTIFSLNKDSKILLLEKKYAIIHLLKSSKLLRKFNMSQYTMLLEYTTGKVAILPGTEGKTHGLATQENLHLLHKMGEQLLKEEVILSYQILKVHGLPICNEFAAKGERLRAEIIDKM